MPAVIGLALTLLFAAPPPDGRFAEGQSFFVRAAEARSPDLFRKAAEAWEALAAEGVVDARLFVNIGNARTFAGDAGEAVLAYRRALVVEPGDERAAAGLTSVRRTLGLPEPAAGASSGLTRALFFWHDALSFSARRLLFAALWAGGFMLLAASVARRRLRVPAVAAVALGAALLVSIVVSDAAAPGRAEAVLTARTEGRTGDGEFYSASHSAPLPAGAELTVLERRGAWTHARLRDGSSAWLPSARVTPVIP